ncbi:MAG: FliA/WhiG family RNA polymerase sigma factor [Deltaproteobacteria bacterium]|nr:FliA/WhiG family RNA polymerase sigma factor [Deltaproteobacteria bacterium]
MPGLATRQLKKYRQAASSQAGGNGNLEERDRLVYEYAPLVKTIACRMGLRLPSHISLDDLMSAGIMGLLDAIEKFDADKGVEFKSYAEFRIRGAILDELRSMDWAPRSVRRSGKILEEAYRRVEKEKMRPASDEEVAEDLGLDMESFYRLLDGARGISVINEEDMTAIVPTQGATGIAWPMGQNGPETNPLEFLNRVEIREIIAQAIDRLPENEKTAVSLYYYEELTMKEIGKVMGYTESRVSQLHTKAVIRLRNTLKRYFDQ